MKVLCAIFFVIVIIAFIYPKTRVNPGFGPPGVSYTKYECLGLPKYRPISDATIMTCYGVPYPMSATY